MSDKMMKAASSDPELALNDAELAAVAAGADIPEEDNLSNQSKAMPRELADRTVMKNAAADSSAFHFG